MASLFQGLAPPSALWIHFSLLPPKPLLPSAPCSADLLRFQREHRMATSWARQGHFTMQLLLARGLGRPHCGEPGCTRGQSL